MLSSSPPLVVRLDTALPPGLPAGRGTAIFVNGACFHPDQELRRGWLRAGDGPAVRPSAWRAPRADLVPALGEPRAYRSGFWATLPIAPQGQPGQLAITLEVELQAGGREVLELGAVEVAAPPVPAGPATGAVIAVCLATHEPDRELLHRQIESLRAQTDTDWICLIGDDASGPERVAEIEALLAGDSRFTLIRSEDRLGPYRNFERLLSQLPPGPSLVALCDQDDRWRPDKLSRLRSQLGPAQLVYSDQRVVDREGRTLAETMWRGRRNQWRDLTSLLVANSVTGAASLIRREVVELALPFPEAPGLQLHDHWLALVARALGALQYVDEPLSDYVQHGSAVLGQVHGAGRGAGAWDARAAYFYGFLAREVLGQALLNRCGERIEPGQRRALERFIASQRSPLGLAALVWRGLTRRRHNLGTELELARGIVWKALVPLRAGRQAPGRSAFDASCPPATAENLGTRRLARWRASL